MNIPCVLLAPTGRAAKVLAQYSGTEAHTIHKRIYRQRTNADYESKYSLDINREKGVCIHRRRDVDALRLHARRTNLRQRLAARRPYNIRTQRAAVPSDSCGRRRAASARRGRPLPRPRCRRNAFVRRGCIFVDDGRSASGCRLGNTPQRHRPAADARTRRGGGCRT